MTIIDLTIIITRITMKKVLEGKHGGNQYFLHHPHCFQISQKMKESYPNR